jgi:preprotein translocase subunit SecA
MASVLTRIFGSANERVLRRLWPLVREIGALETELQQLPAEAFPARTAEWRRRLAAEEVTLDDILPEACR